MITLQDHGIGTGKYKVGAEIADNRLEMNLNKGMFEEVWQTPVFPQGTIPLCCVVDNEFNLYVGSRGSFTLSKYDKNGSLLWTKNDHENISYIKYDKYEECLWVYEEGTRISKISTADGTVILNIPYIKAYFRSIDFNSNQLVIAHYSKAAVADNIQIYSKSGTLISNLPGSHLSDVRFMDGDLIAVSYRATERLTTGGVVIWTLNRRVTPETPSNKGYIFFAGNGDIWVSSSTLNILSRLSPYGEVIGLYQDNGLAGSPVPICGNDINTPVMVASDGSYFYKFSDNGSTLYRQANSSIYAIKALCNFSAMDLLGDVYIVHNRFDATGSNKVVKYDAKSYYKITS